jgi:hypothetical protein
MNPNDVIMSSFHDHIMANTWRLIFERQIEPAQPTLQAQSKPDFMLLEQLLPEYRLIGLALADHPKQRRLN